MKYSIIFVYLFIHLCSHLFPQSKHRVLTDLDVIKDAIAVQPDSFWARHKKAYYLQSDVSVANRKFLMRTNPNSSKPLHTFFNRKYTLYVFNWVRFFRLLYLAKEKNVKTPYLVLSMRLDEIIHNKVIFHVCYEEVELLYKKSPDGMLTMGINVLREVKRQTVGYEWDTKGQRWVCML